MCTFTWLWLLGLASSTTTAADWPELHADSQYTDRTRDEVRQLPQGHGQGQSRCRFHWAWYGPCRPQPPRLTGVA